MKVTIFGIGYVGLVQGAVLANAGHEVVCVDVDQEKIDNLNKSIIPIFEPGLTPLVEDNLRGNRLTFTTDAEIGVAHGDLQFIAVGTPPDEDGSADLKYVLAVAKTIGRHMETSKIIVNKSTVPVGTADAVNETVSRILQERGCSLDFTVVSNPEFLKEGAAVSDCTRPDRIIVGTDNEGVMEVMRNLYAPFNRNHDRMIFMDVRSAELTKYAANCMLATKISFMNEMASIAEFAGADIESVRKGIGADERIGYHFIYPGCGYGGSCFPKDVKALIQQARENGCKSEVLTAVENVNSRQKRALFDKIYQHFGGGLNGRTFAIWGLSFKPNTDDMRDAPSRVLMESFWQAGAKVRAFDPVAMEECHRIYGDREDLMLSASAEDALEGADALVLVTEWQQFKAPNFSTVKTKLKSPVIFDGRNQYDPDFMRESHFTYYSIGRQAISSQR